MLPNRDACLATPPPRVPHLVIYSSEALVRQNTPTNQTHLAYRTGKIIIYVRLLTQNTTAVDPFNDKSLPLNRQISKSHENRQPNPRQNRKPHATPDIDIPQRHTTTR
jgi:hypothetical protein